MKRYSISYIRFVNENYSKTGIRFHYAGRTDSFEETIENYKNNRRAYGMRIVDSQTKEVVFEEIRPIKGILYITRTGFDNKPHTIEERFVDLDYMREWEHRYMYGDFSKNVIKVEREILRA